MRNNTLQSVRRAYRGLDCGESYNALLRLLLSTVSLPRAHTQAHFSTIDSQNRRFAGLIGRNPRLLLRLRVPVLLLFQFLKVVGSNFSLFFCHLVEVLLERKEFVGIADLHFGRAFTITEAMIRGCVARFEVVVLRALYMLSLCDDIFIHTTILRRLMHSAFQ